MWDVELAVWSLTMMALGGTAVLPQNQGSIDPDGLQPNRNLILWPYSRWQDPRLHLHDDFVLVEGQPMLPPCKLGALNRHGWLGYQRGDSLFLKQFQPQPEADHIDMGCNAEIYVNDEFLELETLSPLTRLAPGAALQHTETWTFISGLGTAVSSDQLRQTLAQLV